MAARGPKNPGARSSEKNPDFLKFIGPLTTLWVLQSSQIVHLISTESLLARAVFTRLNRVLGWQPGTQNPGSTIFRKKRPSFLKFIEPVTPLWVLCPSEIMRVGFLQSPLARAEQCLQGQLKCLDGSQGPQNSGSTIFRKKTS